MGEPPLSVENLPAPIPALPWLDRLLLANQALTKSRYFLSRTTLSDTDAKQPDAKPKVSHKKVLFPELRQVLEVFFKGQDLNQLSTRRRYERQHIPSQADARLPFKPPSSIAFEIPSQEIERSVGWLLGTFHPYLEDAALARRHAYREMAFNCLEFIESEIRARIEKGARDDNIICTADIPADAWDGRTTVNTQGELQWTGMKNISLTYILYDKLPDNHPLRKLDRARLPKLSQNGVSPGMILLGPALKHIYKDQPRCFYYLSTAEAWTTAAFKQWAEKHNRYLQSNKDTTPGFLAWQHFEELRKKPFERVFEYPKLQEAPTIFDGKFAARACFMIDLLGRVGSYITPPPLNTDLQTLLAARRVFVSEGDDERQDLYESAMMWVATWYSNNYRDDMQECLSHLALTCVESVEKLRNDEAADRLEQFQKKLLEPPTPEETTTQPISTIRVERPIMLSTPERKWVFDEILRFFTKHYDFTCQPEDEQKVKSVIQKYPALSQTGVRYIWYCTSNHTHTIKELASVLDTKESVIEDIKSMLGDLELEEEE